MKNLSKEQRNMYVLLGVSVAVIILGLVFLVAAMKLIPLFSAIGNALGRYLIVIGTMSVGIMLFSNAALRLENDKQRKNLTIFITVFAFVLTLPLVYVFIAIFPANVGIMGPVGRDVMMLDDIVAGFHAWFGSGAFVYVVYAFMLVLSVVFLLEPLFAGICVVKGNLLQLFGKKNGKFALLSVVPLPVLARREAAEQAAEIEPALDEECAADTDTDAGAE